MLFTEDFFGRMESIPLETFFGKKDSLATSRKEYKFLVPIEHLRHLIDFLADDFYYCKGSGGDYAFQYKSMYFDTKDYLFFKHHRQGRFNRIKIRTREYQNKIFDTFIECKIKVSGTKTHKKRSKINVLEYGLDHEFIHKSLAEYGLKTSDLTNRTHIRYTRVFLSSKDFSKRITIDFDVFAKGEGKCEGCGVNSSGCDAGGVLCAQEVPIIPKYFILEIKEKGRSHEIIKFLRTQYHVHETGFSKYCVSLCALHKHLKVNKWKQIFKKYF